jgi:hypothetical protein
MPTPLTAPPPQGSHSVAAPDGPTTPPPSGPTVAGGPTAALGSLNVPPPPPGCTTTGSPTMALGGPTARGIEAGGQTATLGSWLLRRVLHRLSSCPPSWRP